MVVKDMIRYNRAYHSMKSLPPRMPATEAMGTNSKYGMRTAKKKREKKR